MEGYAKLKKWEVYNFMSIEHGVCEFDESNIIFLKGYNDSGKSSMLRALDILFYNKNAQSQVQFIQDDKDYFRVVAYFDDDIIILRDKYINGQSLYEMYKGSECIFTTKVNNVLTKVTEVPEPIALYLGVLPELNTRTCYDKQFAVQTSGSETYKAFSVILKSEELAKAGELVNNDKNKLGSDIASIETKIDAYKDVAKDGSKLTDDLLKVLEKHDNYIDFYESLSEYLQRNVELSEQLKNTIVPPEVSLLDTTELDLLSGISRNLTELRGIKTYPEVSTLEDVELNSLLGIKDMISQLGGISVAPEVSEITTEKVVLLLNIKNMVDSAKQYDVSYLDVADIDVSALDMLLSMTDTLGKIPDISKYDTELESVNNEIRDLALQLGDDVVICPDCGHVLLDDEGHIHRG